MTRSRLHRVRLITVVLAIALVSMGHTPYQRPGVLQHPVQALVDVDADCQDAHVIASSMERRGIQTPTT